MRVSDVRKKKVKVKSSHKHSMQDLKNAYTAVEE